MSINNFPQIFAETRRFTTGVPRSFEVTSDGDHILFLRSKAPTDPVLCLWALHAQSGTERLLVDPRNLGGDEDNVPAAELARRERARESANGIVRYSVSDDSSMVCFALSGALAVARIADGDVTLCDIAGAAFDPRFSPDGSCIAYLSDSELRVFAMSDGSPKNGSDRLVSAEDAPTVSWGAAEFVAAEEMGRSRGFWWLPSSDALLTARVDTALVDLWWIADPAHPERPASPNRYPAAGTNNANVELWLINIETHARVGIKWDDESRFEYLADVLTPKDSAPLVVRQTRDQRTVSIAEINLEDGTVTEIHRITDETWVELLPGSPTVHESGLLTIEDKTADDLRALCLNGEPLTPPELWVRSILGVHEKRVLITASPEPSEIHLYEIELETGEVRRLTTDSGVHGAAVSKSTVVVSSATPDSYRTSTKVGSHTIANLCPEPPMAANPLFMELGSRSLSAAVFIPTGHNGSSPLPVLLDPYGGPHGQRVVKNHNPHLVSRWFAELGFAVIVTDGRGTPGRGPQFERAVWGDLASAALEDQIDALDAADAEFGFLDLDRVGIRGWSFGGYLAALAVLRAPERFHCAIAGAPVTNWELYDTHYTERYLGHPRSHKSHYEKTNLINEAANLTRPLLLIHGLADDNVVAAHTLQLSARLLAEGRPHQVLPLSGVTHMTPQVAVAENLLRIQLEFLQDCLE